MKLGYLFVELVELVEGVEVGLTLIPVLRNMIDLETTVMLLLHVSRTVIDRCVTYHLDVVDIAILVIFLLLKLLKLLLPHLKILEHLPALELKDVEDLLGHLVLGILIKLLKVEFLILIELIHERVLLL